MSTSTKSGYSALLTQCSCAPAGSTSPASTYKPKHKDGAVFDCPVWLLEEMKKELKAASSASAPAPAAKEVACADERIIEPISITPANEEAKEAPEIESSLSAPAPESLTGDFIPLPKAQQVRIEHFPGIVRKLAHLSRNYCNPNVFKSIVAYYAVGAGAVPTMDQKTAKLASKKNADGLSAFRGSFGDVVPPGNFQNFCLGADLEAFDLNQVDDTVNYSKRGLQKLNDASLTATLWRSLYEPIGNYYLKGQYPFKYAAERHPELFANLSSRPNVLLTTNQTLYVPSCYYAEQHAELADARYSPEILEHFLNTRFDSCVPFKFYVIDIDAPKEGEKDGALCFLDTLAAAKCSDEFIQLFAKNGCLKDGVIVDKESGEKITKLAPSMPYESTVNGGMHFYFKLTEEVENLNLGPHAGNGFDIRIGGSYINGFPGLGYQAFTGAGAATEYPVLVYMIFHYGVKNFPVASPEFVEVLKAHFLKDKPKEVEHSAGRTVSDASEATPENCFILNKKQAEVFAQESGFLAGLVRCYREQESGADADLGYDAYKNLIFAFGHLYRDNCSAFEIIPYNLKAKLLEELKPCYKGGKWSKDDEDDFLDKWGEAQEPAKGAEITLATVLKATYARIQAIERADDVSNDDLNFTEDLRASLEKFNKKNKKRRMSQVVGEPSAANLEPWTDTTCSLNGKKFEGGKHWITGVSLVERAHIAGSRDLYLDLLNPEKAYSKNYLNENYSVVFVDGKEMSPTKFLTKCNSLTSITYDIRYPTGLLYNAEANKKSIEPRVGSCTLNVSPAGVLPEHVLQPFGTKYHHYKDIPRYNFLEIEKELDPFSKSKLFGHSGSAARGNFEPYGGKEMFNKLKSEVEGNLVEFFAYLQKAMPKESDRDIFLDYVAHTMQQPGVKEYYSIWLCGRQGSGKDSLISLVYSQSGFSDDYYATVTDNDICSGFNGYLEEAAVLNVSEAGDSAKGSNQSAVLRALKPIIAGNENVMVNVKYGSQHFIPNCLGVIVTTNNVTNGRLEIDFDDRRIVPLLVDREKVSNKALTNIVAGEFVELLHKLKKTKHTYSNGMVMPDINAIAYYLYWFRDLSKFKANIAPRTELKERMIEASNTFFMNEEVFDDAKNESAAVLSQAIAEVSLTAPAPEGDTKSFRGVSTIVQTMEEFLALRNSPETEDKDIDPPLFFSYLYNNHSKDKQIRFEAATRTQFCNVKKYETVQVWKAAKDRFSHPFISTKQGKKKCIRSAIFVSVDFLQFLKAKKPDEYESLRALIVSGEFLKQNFAPTADAPAVRSNKASLHKGFAHLLAEMTELQLETF